MGDTDGRRGRAGGVSAGSVAVALVAVVACVLAFLVTSRLLQDQGASPSGAEQPTSPVTDPPVRCWDGTRAAAPAGCREPDASPAAFAWVFPDVDLDLCTTRGTPERTIVKCYRGEVEMNLSRWRTTAAALTYYRAEMGGEGAAVEGGRLVWTAPTVRFGVPQQKSAVMYADHPWSLTTYAATEAGAVRAQRASWMRPAAELRAARRGRP